MNTNLQTDIAPLDIAPQEYDDAAPQENLATDLTTQVQNAQTDKCALNALLCKYTPFIKKCVSGVFFKEQSRADNYTEAMLAFVHSVKTYKSEQGAFIQYAQAVIRNRLIDSARKEMLVQKRFFSFSTFSARDTNAEAAWENDILGNDVSGNLASMQIYNREEEEQNLRLEIEAVNGEFSKWGFSWAGLLKKCPKQKRSRLIALRAAHAIREDSALLAETLKNRQLPLARLAETFPRKALEKYRHYIVALVILLQGDYPYVYSFLPQEQL